jgi:hypothetical protein
MQTIKQHIPIRVAKLIIGYLNNLITMAEHHELEEWVSSSEDNVRIFEELTEGVAGNVFDAERLIAETEDPIELWIIGGLITRYLHNELSPIQQVALEEWINATEKNKEVFEMLTSQANLQKLAVWSSPIKEYFNNHRCILQACFVVKNI